MAQHTCRLSWPSPSASVLNLLLLERLLGSASAEWEGDSLSPLCCCCESPFSEPFCGWAAFCLATFGLTVNFALAGCGLLGIPQPPEN